MEIADEVTTILDAEIEDGTYKLGAADEAFAARMLQLSKTHGIASDPQSTLLAFKQYIDGFDEFLGKPLCLNLVALRDDVVGRIARHVKANENGKALDLMFDLKGAEMHRDLDRIYPDSNTDFEQAEEATVAGCNMIEDFFPEIFDALTEEQYDAIRSEMNDAIHGGLT